MQDLLDDMYAGDERAWAQFLDRYGALVYNAVHRTVEAYSADVKDQLDDIFQEVLLRLVKNDYRSLRAYNPERSAPGTFLHVLARNVTIDRLRARRPTQPTEAEVLERVPAPEIMDAPLPRVPVELLSDRQRLIMHLYYDEELSVREIAERLDIQEQTVRSAQHKALQKIRRHFEEHPEQLETRYSRPLFGAPGEAERL